VADSAFVQERAIEGYGMLYDLAWPKEEFVTRMGRQSALDEPLRGAGAVMGEMHAIQRPNWFAEAGSAEAGGDASIAYSYNESKCSWWAQVHKEHAAVRHAAGAFDISSFGKITVSGPDATKFVSWIHAAVVDKPVGSVVYCQMLNDAGGIVADLTVTRVAEQEYYLVVPAATPMYIMEHLKLHQANFDVNIADVSDEYAAISVQGPLSRQVLCALTAQDQEQWGPEAFPFGQSRDVDINGVRCKALRLTYVGELGEQEHTRAHGTRGCLMSLFRRHAHLMITVCGQCRLGAAHPKGRCQCGIRAAYGGRRRLRPPQLRHVRDGHAKTREGCVAGLRCNCRLFRVACNIPVTAL
jgi:4-methylaminobutanoate oxidase (formaldehyde-forming)